MIKPNELRIGNWIYINKPIQVVDVMCDSVNTIEHEGYIDFWPIPLTEEWLLRFGFSRLVIGKPLPDEFEKDSIILAMPTNEGAGFQVCIEKKYINLNIVWVHHLQNLYFALTGEELTIE